MAEYLETKSGKFTFRVATDRLYTAEGVWMKPDPDARRLRVGVADYLQQHSGDVAFASVEAAGARVRAGERFAEIETVKAMVELHAPVSGTILEANPALGSSPELINDSPFEKGWLAVMEPAAWDAECPKLLSAAAYFPIMEAQIEEELKSL